MPEQQHFAARAPLTFAEFYDNIIYNAILGDCRYMETTKVKSPLKKRAVLFESICSRIVCVMMIAVSGFLALVSLLHTTGMEIVREGQGVDSIVYRIKEKIESVVYYNDNLILNLLLLVLAFGICFVILPRLKKIPMFYELLFIAVWTVALGSVWVVCSQVAPTEDSNTVATAAAEFANNNFSALSSKPYFHQYSFQLGYVFFTELIIRLHNLFAPTTNLLYLQFLNVVFLALTYVGLLLINHRLFKDKCVVDMTVLIFALSVQPIISSVFIYGIIPGLMFAVWAIYFEIVYLQKNSIPCAAVSAVLIAAAVMIKSNNLIVLIAMAGVAFVKLFTRKRLVFDIAYILVAAVLCISISPAVKMMYESRSGQDLGDSVPYSSWIAMGLNESDLAPGWYSPQYTIGNFDACGKDAKKAGEQSMAQIGERVGYFAKNPQYANDFFYLKAVSQWNETSFQSIWNNNVRGQYGEKTFIAKWVCGDGEKPVKRYMDIFTQFIYFAAFFGLLCIIRQKDVSQLILPITVLGGFMYHMLSEGKSQYILPYYILLTAFAAYGVAAAYRLYEDKCKNVKIAARLFGLQNGVNAEDGQ